jgi:benzoylformate decarboxylase
MASTIGKKLHERSAKSIDTQNSTENFSPVVLNSGRECLLEILRSEGVTHIFGNPGTTELPLLDALAAANDIHFVLGLQEATVVGMADGYAQATGRPAFVNLHTTVGLGNGMGNIANVFSTNVPMVITAGQQDRRHLAYEPLLSGDLVGMARSTVKWAHEVRSLQELPIMLRRAFLYANTEPKGPVFLSLPMDIIDEVGTVVVPPRSRILEETTCNADEIAELLLDPSCRICMVVGDEVSRYNATQLATEVAERLGCHVFGSPFFSGVPFPVNHPLWQGILPPTGVQMHQVLSQFDRVLLVGDDAFISYTYSEGQPFPHTAELIHFAVDKHALGRTYAVRAGVCGSPRELLSALALALWKRKRRNDSVTSLAIARANKAALLQQMDAEIAALSSQNPMHPMVAAHAVIGSLPAGTTVVDECIVANEYTRRMLPTTRHNQYYFVRGAGLGWGMPAAVGVSLARRRQPVLCMVGDGAAMYSPQALWTAAHENLPITFVVFKNSEYNILKNYMRARDGYNAQSGHIIGMDLTDPAINYVALAQSMGVDSMRLRSAREIAEFVSELQNRQQPSLIEIPISSTEGSALVSDSATKINLASRVIQSTSRANAGRT